MKQSIISAAREYNSELNKLRDEFEKAHQHYIQQCEKLAKKFHSSMSNFEYSIEISADWYNFIISTETYFYKTDEADQLEKWLEQNIEDDYFLYIDNENRTILKIKNQSDAILYKTTWFKHV